MAYKSKSNYKSSYNKNRHVQKLAPGLTGFLCTCNGKLRERDCLRESHNVLNEFADTLFGPQVPSGPQASEEKSKSEESGDGAGIECDIDASLAKEVESIKSDLRRRPELRRFQAMESGANGVVFIKTTVPDPVKLAHTIVTAYSKGQQKSKFLLRLLPVEATCKAYLDSMCAAAEPLIEKYFAGEPKTFAIVFNHRNNERVKREEVIEKFGDLVYQRNALHKADLKQPQLVILVEVIRSICCLSVVPEYYALRKYNLLENALKVNEGESVKVSNEVDAEGQEDRKDEQGKEEEEEEEEEEGGGGGGEDP